LNSRWMGCWVAS